eukprot:1983983-Amphidinium_carterae.1
MGVVAIADDGDSTPSDVSLHSLDSLLAVSLRGAEKAADGEVCLGGRLGRASVWTCSTTVAA